MNLMWRIARALIAFLFVAMLVLFFEGRRKDAGSVRLTTDIAASPERVWPWLKEGDRAKQWVSWLVEVRKDPDPNHAPLGSREIWVMRDENNGGQSMEVTGICTEYTPFSRMSVHLSVPGSFDGDQTYVLTDLGSGKTRLEVDGHYRYAGWFARLMEPFITPAARKKMEGDMSRLRTLVETTAATSLR